MKLKIISAIIMIFIISTLFSNTVISEEQEETRKISLETQQILFELKSAGIKTQIAQSLLEQINQALNVSDYSTARKTQYQLNTIKRNAFESQEKIKIIEDLLISGEQRWLEMRNTKNMLIMAKAAFDREDFATSLDRVSQSQTIAQVELKSINLPYILYTYWWLIILISCGIILSSRIIYQKLKTSNITAKINNLTNEEINIIHLMKETQEKHFNRRELSPARFHKAMYEYQHRLTKIRREVAHLRTERIKVYSVKKEIEFLQSEEKHVYELIKKSQEDHFVKKIIGENEYDLSMNELHERLAEIEESISKLQYLQQQEIALKRIRNKRKPTRSDFLEHKIEKIILPNEKTLKQRKYEELKKAYEQNKTEEQEEKIEEKYNETKEEKSRIKINKTEASKEKRLQELKKAYEEEKK